MIQRRTFLIGLASVLAAPAIPTIIGPVAVGKLPDALAWRSISEIVIWSELSAEEGAAPKQPITIETFVGGDLVHRVGMHPLGYYRWVAVPGNEIVATESLPISFVVSPCITAVTVIEITSNIERDPGARPRLFSETRRWKDGEIVLDCINALDPRDHLGS